MNSGGRATARDTNYVQSCIPILAKNFSCSPHAVLLIHRHRPHIMGGDSDLSSASSFAVAYRLATCFPTLGSPSPFFFLARICLFSIIFSRIEMGRVLFSRLLSPFVPEVLISRGGFGFPLPRRPFHLPCPGRIWCLIARTSPSSRFPRRCCLFTVAVGTNDSGRRLNRA